MIPFGRRHQYLRVSDYIRVLIRRNRLAENTPLPTENELCKMFQCSRGTVRKAMGLLARAGEVRRRRRAGTFVSKPSSEALQHLCPPTYMVVMGTIGNPFLVRFAHRLHTFLYERGEILHTAVTNDVHEIEMQIIRDAAKHHLKGVLKFATNPEFEEETRDLLRSLNLPYVVLNDFWMDSPRDQHVAYDECAAMETAVEHLAKLGHRRIALVDSDGWTRTRLLEAFFRTMQGFGLPVDNSQVLLCRPNTVPPLEKLSWHDGTSPTAIVAVYPAMAAHLVASLQGMEVAVPGDVSVVSIEGRPLDMPFAGIDLTATVPPIQAMINRALKLLERGEENIPVRQYLFRSEFHVGNTTAPIAEKGNGSEREAAMASQEKNSADKEGG